MTTETVEPTTEQAEWIAQRKRNDVTSLRVSVILMLGSLVALGSTIIAREMKVLWTLGETSDYMNWLIVSTSLLAVVGVAHVLEFLFVSKRKRALGEYPTSEGGLEKPTANFKLTITDLLIALVDVTIIAFVVVLTLQLP